MKIEPVFTFKDGYEFRINDMIVLEILGTAISVLKIDLPSSGNIKEFYKNIIEQFDIEKMINDLLNKNNKINRIVIDSEVCRVDDKIIFQTEDLAMYKR
ncbi:MAG: hypothetical protein UW11_C0006G0015 [Parcubacteria group bacterium GW2011_GWA2_43_9b]|uniref:Uncharacterized protein n=1 Tax=Candidatus Portnoybacteria bacterium RIFCSPLOWO2_02_FULL_39_11 TaxID=1802001 RepID=A0A1G2FSI3_9BACT|nr:MAG: hypothetical protein UW11_C0006G0015 [Parcubacteria group bacterium GW2011_GWA2_43_9b]OGZ41039.1 MAG: hypothetical protein A3B04_02865 [Candidatus Portnoybacteria bacterium RIFCSPLOWO2_02_FULL_39_11]